MTPEVAQVHNQRAAIIVTITLFFAGSVGYLIGGANGAAWGLAASSLIMGIVQLLPQ